jgi:replication factor C small subunit
MEKYSASCRFVLACNEISRIIDAIQSRCVVFKFKALGEDALNELLKKVISEEKIKVEEEAQDLLVRISKGDVRKLLNTLQAAASITKEIKIKEIEEVMDFVDPKEIEAMIAHAMKGDFMKAREELIKLRSVRGLSALEILKEVYKRVLELELDSKIKVRLIDRIASVEFRIVEGSDEELQLEALLAMMALLK